VKGEAAAASPSSPPAFQGTARFRIDGCLGMGGMGVVYGAFDLERRHAVALKTLRHIDGENLYQLKREFRSLADLHHPNLVRLHELHEHQGDWFFTLELVPGDDFLGHVRGDSQAAATADAGSSQGDTVVDPQGQITRTLVRDGELTPAPVPATAPATSAPPSVCCDLGRLRAALIQLVEGLQHLHGAHLVHRDIKPSNVRVTPEGRVVILDFGLVGDTRQSEPSDGMKLAGTPLYMAPEQLGSAPAGPAADLYAVGTLLYQALTGEPPFREATAMATLFAKQTLPPPAPGHRDPSVPADLDRLCVELLATDPAARPTGPEVLQRLRASSPAPAGAVTGLAAGMPFVGRQRELAALEQARRDQLRSGRPLLVVVEADSGLGKSALLHHFVGRLATGGPVGRVLVGRCYEQESVPYKAFDGVIDSLSRQLVGMGAPAVRELSPARATALQRVFPVLERVQGLGDRRGGPGNAEPVAAPALRQGAFGALRELLGNLVRLGPLLVLIDDLQWADADSLSLLRELCRGADAPGILWLLSSRPLSSSASRERPASAAPDWARQIVATLEGLTELPRRTVPLDPLSAREASQLAGLWAERSGAAPEVASGAVAGAAGHPLFIQQLVLHGVTTTASLDRALLARVVAQGPAARHLLELLAVAGGPLEPFVLAQAARLGGEAYADAAAALRAAHLCRAASGRTASGADRVEPYHDRVREAVLASLTPASQVAHHRALARALAQTEAALDDPRLLVRHLAAAGEHERAAASAERAAAGAVQVLAFELAADLLAAALDNLPEQDDGSRRLALELSRAEALAWAGQGARAAEIYRRLGADPGIDAVTRFDCRRRASELWLASGHLELGRAALDEVLAELGLTLGPTPASHFRAAMWERARLRLRGLAFREVAAAEVPALTLAQIDALRNTGLALAMIDTVPGLALLVRSIRMSLEVGEPVRVMQALGFEAVYRAQLGRHRPAAQLSARSAALADATGDDFVRLWSQTTRATVLFHAGQFATAAELFGKTEAERDPLRITLCELNVSRTFHLLALQEAGELALGRRVAEEHLRDAVERGDRYSETTFRRAAPLCFLAEDAAPELRRHLEEAAWSPPEGGFHIQHWYELWARTELALHEAARGRGLERMGPLSASLEQVPLTFMMAIQYGRARTRHARGRLALAQAHLLGEAGGERRRSQLAVARQAARRLRAEKVPHAAAWSLLLTAGVQALEGAPLPARVETLRRTMALDAGGAARMPWHLAAVTRHALAALVGGDEGRALAEEAAALQRRAGIRDLAGFARVIAPGAT
jgi:hypothetical protein